MAVEAASNIYVNVVVRVNEGYGALQQHLEEMDTRVCYLKIFELALSSALPKPLWEVEIYRKQARMTPMPEDPYTVISFEEFRGWMTIYEMIMRSEGLIGKKPRTVLGMEELM